MKSLAFDRKLGYVHRVFYQREYAADIKVTKLKNYLFALYRESGKSKIGIIKAYAGVIFRWLFTQNCIGIVYNASIMIYYCKHPTNAVNVWCFWLVFTSK